MFHALSWASHLPPEQDRGTHSLSVYKEGRAFGAGGEHLRRADKLGPDSPEIVS